MVKREKVLRGEEPMAVIRDPNHAIIDTNLDESLRRAFDNWERPILMLGNGPSSTRS